MNEMRPFVSVIMPAYNAERFVEKAIRSVMVQTFTNWELLVLDDGSSDSTRAIVERLAAEDSRIRLICNETNLGTAATRNRGLELMQEGYAAFLDCDDVWHPEKLSRQIARMEECSADLCCCSYAVVDEEGIKAKHDYIIPASISYKHMLMENSIGCSTVVLSPNAASVYRFDASFYHEDYLLWLRMLSDGCVAVGCREILASWRMTTGSRSANKLKSARNRWRIYRNYFHFPLWKSLWLLGNYAVAGIRKYR